MGDTGKATGVYGSELTIAYYEFLDAGMTVDIAIIANGLVLVFAGRDGHWTWWGLLIGILYVLFGIFVIAHPLVTIGALVWIFAFWALVAGILAIVLAFRLRGLAK